MKFIIITVISILFTYGLFSDEFEYDEPERPPTKKKYLKVKRNGQWVDEEK